MSTPSDESTTTTVPRLAQVVLVVDPADGTLRPYAVWLDDKCETVSVPLRDELRRQIAGDAYVLGLVEEIRRDTGWPLTGQPVEASSDDEGDDEPREPWQQANQEER